MLVHIPSLLAADQIASIHARLDAAPWADYANRALLFDLDNAVRALTQTGRAWNALLQLTACSHNLLRRWGDV
jgi:predicted 2-oxoglutarate/Fe(II)-dependent dioxygenase YbiX